VAAGVDPRFDGEVGQIQAGDVAAGDVVADAVQMQQRFWPGVLSQAAQRHVEIGEGPAQLARQPDETMDTIEFGDAQVDKALVESARAAGPIL